MVSPSPTQLTEAGCAEAVRDCADEARPESRLGRWQVVNDPYGGRFIVLGLEGKDDPSSNDEGSTHQGYRVVRDFTGPLNEAVYVSSPSGPERIEVYEGNYASNKGRIRESADAVEPSDVVYLVGSGPGLRKNIKHVGRIGTGVVVGINRTAHLIPTERLDYLFCIDSSRTKDPFPVRLPETVGVLDVTVTPSVHGLKLKRELWFVPSVRSRFYDRVREDHPHLVRLEHGLNVTFTALCWIVRALKAKTIVLVGMDCAFTDSWRHFDEPLMFDADAEYLVAQDVCGRAVITNDVFLSIAEWHTAALYFLKCAGIRVINATEGGLLRNFVEVRDLASTVDELNGKG